MQMKTSVTILIAFFPILLWSQICSPLTYEGFQYNNNSPLNGGGGGSGWATPWYVQSDNNNVPGFQVTNATTLAYLDLQENGLAATGGYAYLTAGRNFDISAGGVFDSFLNNQGQIGAPGTTLYFSCMLAKLQNNNEEAIITLHQDNIAWYGTNPNPKISIGYFGTASNTGGNRYWSINTNGTVQQSNVQVQTGQAALLVLGITFNAGNTVVNYFINPVTIGSANPPAPNISFTYTTPFYFRSLAFYPGSSAGQTALDEIRIADTYRCTTPGAAVTVNNPPVAFFTASATSGNAPLTVNFDAAGSTDDGTIVSYNWDFDDGTTASGITTSHIFTYPTRMNVSLTVIDNYGATNTYSLPIVVRDENGHLSCLTSTAMLQLATCGQNNGSFRANNDVGWVNEMTLRNSTNTVINPASNNGSQAVWQNLAPGTYRLTTTGQYMCADTFNLVIPVDSNSCPGWTPAPCQLQLGTNISGIRYWDLERALKDFKLYSDEFFTYNSNGGGPWNTNLMQEIPVDENGYPLQLPYTTSGGSQNVRLVISADGHMPIGDYVMLYDGAGTFESGGNMAFTSTSAGRIAFSIYDNGNIWLHLTNSQQGNHIRNIRILRASDELIYSPSQPFYQTFMDRLSNFSCIRFMDWQGTNGSPNITWENRANPNYHIQSTERGIAYEYIIRLANILQKDAWICIPHEADDNYIRQMARLFRDSLNQNLKIYLEYSNEVWNWQFLQAHYNDETNRPDIISYPRAYTDKSLHVFTIWYEEFGASAPARIKRVLGTQNTYNWIGEQILAQSKGQFDCFSPTSYFGYDPDACGINAGSSALDIVNCARETYHSNANAYRQEYLNGKLYGKEIINYEGGQHITHNPVTVPWQQAIYDCQVHPEMYNMYVELLDSIRTWGSSLSMNFSFASPRESVYGSWGILEDIDQNLTTQPAPKWQALIDNLHPIPHPVISGSAVACANQQMQYSVVPGPAGTVYHWTVTGGNIISGQGTATITVLWTGGQGNVNIEMENP